MNFKTKSVKEKFTKLSNVRGLNVKEYCKTSSMRKYCLSSCYYVILFDLLKKV